MDIYAYLKNKFCAARCEVLGFGVSNVPLAYLLCELGATVTVRDKNEGIASSDDFKRLGELGVRFVLGEGYLAMGETDYVFRSPGIRPDAPEILTALRGGATLTSEMELFFEVCPCRTVAVTGSDGKTTTTTLTHLFLEKEFSRRWCGRAFVGGNIGTPLLPEVFKMTEDDVAVLELSSFQLQTMQSSPDRAAITNITPNHLNWHVDMDEYITAKCNICRHGKPERLVANAENPIVREIAKNSDVPVVYFSSQRSSYADIVPDFKENCAAVFCRDGAIVYSDGETEEEIVRISEILLPGRHNAENYMTAIALTYPEVSRDTVGDVAKSFGGVEHRLELVRELDGVRFYNSSIDSSPTRTAAALDALGKPPVIILGGSDKNIPFDGLAEDVCRRTKAAVVTGDSAPKILAALEACPLYHDSGVRVLHVPDFEEAVRAAAAMAERGDAVLLSPACASFDAFPNFAVRGKRFKEIVASL